MVSLSPPLNIMPCSRRSPGDGPRTTLTTFLTCWWLREERERELGGGRGEQLGCGQAGTTGLHSTVLGLASCPLAHGST